MGRVARHAAGMGILVPIEVVDINCDMGEAFGRWRVGDTDDASLMPHISSANIATGFHAGDPNLMDQTVRLAVEHGVALGAHPGYDDLQGFGRRKINGTSRELVNDIVYQVGAIVFLYMRDWLSALNPIYWYFWIGLLLVLLMCFFRAGILPTLDRVLRRLFPGRWGRHA